MVSRVEPTARADLTQACHIADPRAGGIHSGAKTFPERRILANHSPQAFRATGSHDRGQRESLSGCARPCSAMDD